MPKITFTFDFKDGTTLSELNRFIKKYHPSLGCYDDPKFYHALKREDIFVDEIRCPICGNQNAEYGCFDAEVTGFCKKCNNYFTEINHCPIYIDNPTSAEQCERCELNDPTICIMRVKGDE